MKTKRALWAFLAGCALSVSSVPALVASSIDIQVKSYANDVPGFPVSECVVEAALTSHSGSKVVLDFDLGLTELGRLVDWLAKAGKAGF